jgi:predicted RNase H-like HicB family nuclease
MRAMPTGTVDRIRLTAVFEPDEDGWINARVLELPGANTCARSVEEAKEMLADAVRELIASYADEARETRSSGTRYETLEIDLR